MAIKLFMPEEHNQPKVDPHDPALKTYLVLGSPRSGSNLLCSMLYRIANYGIPFEYLNKGIAIPTQFEGCIVDPDARQFRKRVNLDAYVDALIANRTTQPSMAWGIKLFPAHFTTLLEAARGPDIVRASKIIRIRREDKLAQAVSWHIATESGAWSSASSKHKQNQVQEVEYDFESIKKLYQTLYLHESFWDLMVVKHNLVPYEFAYEDLITDTRVVGNGLMEHLTDQPSDLDFSTDPEVVKLESQASNKNNRFTERFLSDLGEQRLRRFSRILE